MNNFIVATTKSWNLKAFELNRPKLNGNWILISSKEDLNLEFVNLINPKYIFFPHWSWIVPDEIIKSYNCVCFHMADVPYGRGGSPLQNLIMNGIKNTKISALKMVSELDAGPVYCKLDFNSSFIMPLYEYTCNQCDSEFELLIRGDQPPECPECGSDRLQKQLSVPAAHMASSVSLPMCPSPAAGTCGLPQCGSGGCAFGG